MEMMHFPTAETDRGRRLPRRPRIVPPKLVALRSLVPLEERDRSRGAYRCEVDHITLLRRGGQTIRENLRALCKRCHSARTMRDLNAARLTARR